MKFFWKAFGHVELFNIVVVFFCQLKFGIFSSFGKTIRYKISPR